MSVDIQFGKPTGKRRYRKGWFGRLILQLQFECKIIEYMGGQVDTKTGKIWRDATVEDVTRDDLVQS